MAYRKKYSTSKSSQQKRKGRRSVSAKKTMSVRKKFTKKQLAQYVAGVKAHRGEEE